MPGGTGRSGGFVFECGAEEETAVVDELRAGGEGSLVGGEEEQSLGDVCELAQAGDGERLGRVEVGDRSVAACGGFGDERGGDDAGVDGVDADVVAAQFQ